MATPNQEAIDTFISITGASVSVAVQKLQVIIVSMFLDALCVVCFIGISRVAKLKVRETRSSAIDL